jgi:hypothetical protein
MSGKPTTVATFSDRDKAEAVQKRLEQAGLSAEVVDESKLQKFWFMSRSLAGEKVCVDEGDFPRARQLLEGADPTEHILQGEICCPQCQSPRVEYPQFTRKFVTTTLVEVFCFLRVLDKQFYCTNCQHTWSPEIKLKHELDILNWPRDGKAHVQ